MKILGLLFGFILSVQNSAAETDFSKEVVKSTPLISSLYMLEGAGGNMTALIGPEGVLLVDDDFTQMADKLLAKIKELGGNSPRFIINTHFHYDHTGGNEVFGPKATIIAAKEVRDRLLTEQTLWKERHPPVPPQALPNLVFDKALTIYLNGVETQVQHLPRGHTDGDSVVLFAKGKVASLGDLYFSGMYPIFHMEHNGSLDGYLKNIELILQQLPEDSKIVPGHGPLSTKAEFAQYHKMIVSSISTVRKGLRAGKTLAQIQKSGLAAEWEPFSHGYVTTDRWIAMIYAALKS